jgi:hypothetical protein
MLAVVMVGGYGASEKGIIRAMLGVRCAAGLDLVERLREVDGCRVVVVSDQQTVLEASRWMGCRVWDTRGDTFEWLRVVKEVVRAEAKADEAVLVLGGCAAPLLDSRELEEVAREVRPGEVWQNNRLSPDLVLWKPAAAVFGVKFCRNDNEFGYALEKQGGLNVRFFPGKLGFLFDVDTPVDALLAAGRAECGPRMKRAVKELGHRVRLEEVRKVLCRGDWPDVGLIGRVHPVEAERFGQMRGVRVRIFSEERGMKALGRVERGEVRSLVGAMIEAVGWKRFLEVLGELVACVLFDTRVVLEHFGVKVREAERFAADLGIIEDVEHPFLREMVEAVLKAPVPVVMGGQSLVAGGLRLWL